MPDIINANAELVGLWLQLIATGAYLVYLPGCVKVIIAKMRDGLSIWLPLACAILFLTTIIDQVLALVRAYQGFAIPSEGYYPDPGAYYSNVASALTFFKNLFNIIATLVSDIVMIYRTYIVWNCNPYVLVIPCCLVVVNIFFAAWSGLAMWRATQGEDLILSAITVRFRYYLIFTFILNVLCAGLICWKIWRVAYRVSREFPDSKNSTRRVIDIIIQTAAIYCAHLLALIITTSVGSNVFFLLLDPLPQVASILFSMMIVRAQTSRYANTEETTLPSSSLRFWKNSRSRITQQQTTGVEITLERVVETDSGTVHRLDERVDDSVFALPIVDKYGTGKAIGNI